MVVTRLLPPAPAPRTTIPRPTSDDAKPPDDDIRTFEPIAIEPTPELPPRPAPITWMYLPTSAELNEPDAEMSTADPAVIAPSTRRMPSATAPNAPTVTLDSAHAGGVVSKGMVRRNNRYVEIPVKFEKGLSTWVKSLAAFRRTKTRIFTPLETRRRLRRLSFSPALVCAIVYRRLLEVSVIGKAETDFSLAFRGYFTTNLSTNQLMIYS